MSREIVVIGAGPAGIEAACSAAEVGASVTLVSNAPLGGRAGWHSLLPSKVWLTVADAAGVLLQSGELGLFVGQPPVVDLPLVLERIREIARDWHHEIDAQLQELSVRFLLGDASLLGPHRVHVNSRVSKQQWQIEAEAIILATGSVPVFPPGLEPNGRTILAPRFAKHLERIPETIAVVGAGPTGCEFTYLFSRLGARVIWIFEEPGILPDFHPAAGAMLAESMQSWGVHCLPGQTVVGAESDDTGVTLLTRDGRPHTVQTAFVAVGRRPDLDGLRLTAAGLADSRGGLSDKVDGFGRVGGSHIYLVGDAAGPPMLANRAMAQARVAGRHAAGVSTRPFRPETVVAAVYTEPQVAQVGYVQSGLGRTIRIPLIDTLKARLVPDGEGFFELHYESGGRILGAVAVGPHAVEMVSPIAQAVQLDACLPDLADLFPAHPTMSELPYVAIRRALLERRSPD